MTDDATSPNVASSQLPLPLALVLVAVGSAALYGATYVPASRDAVAPLIGLRLITYPVLFGLYFLAVYVVWRDRLQAGSARLTALVLGGALLFRGLVLTGPVARNNDTWRYLWEGRVVLEGMNPYAAPPASEAYDGVRRELDEAGDHLYEELMPKLNTVRSVYGPIASGIFVLPHLLPFDRVWSMRLIMTLFDVGAVLVLMAMLRSLGRAPALALIYAWNPVGMCGYADRAHIDAPMTFFVALAAYLMCLRKSGWAGVAFGAALLVKLSPLYLALPFLRIGRLRFGATLVLMGVLGSIPFVLAGEGSLSGFREFSARWHNTDSIFGLLLLILQPLKGVIKPAAMARALVLVGAPTYAVWRTLQGEKTHIEWLFKTCAAIAAAGILLSPVVHPWYTTHMLIFLVFVPNPGMLLLTCATMSWFLRFWKPPDAGLGAAILAPFKRYCEPWRWLAYPPVFALLIHTWLKRRRPTPPSSSCSAPG